MNRRTNYRRVIAASITLALALALTAVTAESASAVNGVRKAAVVSLG